MKKLAMILMVMILLLSCGKTEFEGNMSMNDSRIIMDYTILDKTLEHELTLNAGDALTVAIDHQSGSLGVTLTDEDGQEIYQGHQPFNQTFILDITSSGQYTVKIVGEDASGAISIENNLE